MLLPPSEQPDYADHPTLDTSLYTVETGCGHLTLASEEGGGSSRYKQQWTQVQGAHSAVLSDVLVAGATSRDK